MNPYDQLRQRAGDQPLPEPGARDVVPYVIADVRRAHKAIPGIRNGVCEDLDARLRVGIQRYGQPLQTFNGRDAVRDAYEEKLDALNYLKQAIMEEPNPTLESIYERTVLDTIELKRFMQVRANAESRK